MNFDFSDELKQLRDEARRFLTDRCAPAVPRRILEGSEPYDRALWQSIAEMGWTGAAISRGIARGGPTLIDCPVGELPDPWSLVQVPRNRPRKS